MTEKPLGWDDVWRFYPDKAGKFRWTRRAQNGEIVGASSQGYFSIRDCEANAARMGWRASGPA